MERRARWRATVREQFEDFVGRRAFGRQRLGERRWYVARHRIPFDILHGLPCLSSFGVQLHCNHDLDSKGGGRPNGSYQQCSKHQNVAPRVASCFVCLSTWGHKVGLHFLRNLVCCRAEVIGEIWLHNRVCQSSVIHQIQSLISHMSWNKSRASTHLVYSHMAAHPKCAAQD